MAKVFVEPKEIKKENARFIDTRFDLQNASWGQSVYNEGHIEGAIYWDLEKDLSDMSKKEGRHPMPSKEKLKRLFEKAGLTYSDNIYIYDQGAAPFSARAWYMLTYANFPNVFIVNGGIEKLIEEGFSLTKEIPTYPSTNLLLNWNESIFANHDDVKKVVDEKTATLLDARSNVRYRGDFEPIDKKAGHIPTAKNFDWEQLISDNTLKWNEKLLTKVKKDDAIIVYCGSGVTASPLYAMLQHKGFEKLKLYVGSFSDWIEYFDVETGDNE